MSERKGPWYRQCANELTHPKLTALASELRLPTPMVIGCLALLRMFAVVHRDDGVLHGMTDEQIETAAQVPKKCRGKFVPAAIKVGYLNGDAMRRCINSFESYYGNKKEALRKADYRHRNAESENVSRDNPPKSREEKRREEKKDNTQARADAPPLVVVPHPPDVSVAERAERWKTLERRGQAVRLNPLEMVRLAPRIHALGDVSEEEFTAAVASMRAAADTPCWKYLIRCIEGQRHRAATPPPARALRSFADQRADKADEWLASAEAQEALAAMNRAMDLKGVM